ncbi:hypothetical protein DXG01_001858, partial [Tephrocybe rancida]
TIIMRHSQVKIPHPTQSNQHGHLLIKIKKESHIRRGTKVHVRYGSKVEDVTFVEHLWLLHVAGAYRRELEVMEITSTTQSKLVWVSKDMKVKLGARELLVMSNYNCWKGGYTKSTTLSSRVMNPPKKAQAESN